MVVTNAIVATAGAAAEVETKLVTVATERAKAAAQK